MTDTARAAFLLDRIVAARGHLLRVADGVPAERWTVTPPGFSNNVLWNVAHVVVTLELLAYGRSSLDLGAPPALVAQTRKGTSPSDWTAPPDRDAVLALARSSPQRIARDLADGRFRAFEPYDTSAGVHLDSLADALAFDLYHEGMHAGTVLSLRRVLAG